MRPAVRPRRPARPAAWVRPAAVAVEGELDQPVEEAAQAAVAMSLVGLGGLTGNLLAAYGEIKGVRGTIISFTKADGVIEQGILLPKLFDFSKNTQGDYRLRSGAEALNFLQQSTNKDIGRFGISTRDGQVRVLPRGDGVQVRVPKSKAQGARYFLDKNLIAARLGMQPETLSRGLAKLRVAGIETSGQELHVRDVARLRSFVARDDDR